MDLQRLPAKRLAVVGDLIHDEYIWGSVNRLNPEAPALLVDIKSTSSSPGGAANVAANVLSMGAQVNVYGVVGTDLPGSRTSEALRTMAADGTVQTVEGYTTPHKLRVMANHQQVLRVDSDPSTELPNEITDRVAEDVEAALPELDGLIISDYSKGLLTTELAHRLLVHTGLPVYVDPKDHFAMYAGATLIKPNLQEALAFTGEATPREAARELRTLLGLDVAITCGAEGMVVATEAGAPLDVPTLTLGVRDVQGAGDTAMAALALSRCAGATLEEAAVIANTAAGIAVSRAGTATVHLEDIQAVLPAVIADARRRQAWN
jgi:D-beta-D-heptose 7-phosphate kinase/D-beta-D-heptose 1-phosphate adenosyltransferase